jgi:hypothetical protein
MTVQSGQAYGSLMVLRLAKSTNNGNQRFMCRCLCGLIQSYRASELRNGKRSKCHVCERVERRQAEKDGILGATPHEPSSLISQRNGA